MLGQHLHIFLHLVIERVQKCSGVVLAIIVKGGNDGEGGKLLGSEGRIKSLDWLEIDDHLLTEEGALASPQQEVIVGEGVRGEGGGVGARLVLLHLAEFD